LCRKPNPVLSIASITAGKAVGSGVVSGARGCACPSTAQSESVAELTQSHVTA